MQAEYRKLDMRHVSRTQSLQFTPSIDTTAAIQLSIRSIRDTLSGIFDVADPAGAATLDLPPWSLDGIPDS